MFISFSINNFATSIQSDSDEVIDLSECLYIYSFFILNSAQKELLE